MKTELEAIAKTLDRSSAKLLRDVLAEAMPRLRKQADEEIKRKEKLPHGITPDELEKSLAALHRKLLSGDAIHIEQQDLLGPESKAVWVLLGYLWESHATDEDRNAVKTFLDSLSSAVPKPTRRVPK
ncbi:MAG TPA: hypothetical protein VGE74_12330 [Gemmata sp.]